MNIGKDGTAMVVIPAGEFLMGSESEYPNERPVHKPETCQYPRDGGSRWASISNENIGSCWKRGRVQGEFRYG